MRVGQKNGLVYQWAKKGTRPRQPKDQRYANAYVFGADTITHQRYRRRATCCPMPTPGPCNSTWTRSASMSRLARMPCWCSTRPAGTPPGSCAAPANITLLHLPSASPELNPAENIWQYLRQTHLSNRVFDSYKAVVRACCSAWKKLVRRGRPHRLHSNPQLGYDRSMPMKVGIRGPRACRAPTRHRDIPVGKSGKRKLQGLG